MFWIGAAVVVVASFALSWFVSGRSKKKFGDPTHGPNTGAAKGYSAMKDVRRQGGGNGPGGL
jgi:hypothetical protein